MSYLEVLSSGIYCALVKSNSEEISQLSKKQNWVGSLPILWDLEVKVIHLWFLCVRLPMQIRQTTNSNVSGTSKKELHTLNHPKTTKSAKRNSCKHIDVMQKDVSKYNYYFKVMSTSSVRHKKLLLSVSSPWSESSPSHNLARTI